MATPQLVASTRFLHRGVTKCYYIPTIVDAGLTPTRAEMDAGTDLSGEIADWTGWMVASGEIPTPELASVFEGNIPGGTFAEESSITFYADKEGVDVRTVLPRDTEGFIMILDGGDTAANKADVFPIRVRSNGKERSLTDTAARILVQFSITAEPAENVTVPA